MQHLVHLTSLCLYSPNVTGAALTAAAHRMSRLQSLIISDGLGEHLQALRQMPHLQDLRVELGIFSRPPPLTAQDVANIAYATSLTCLYLYAADIEPAAADLSSLSTLVELEHLTVSTGEDDVFVTFGNHTLDRHLLQLRQLIIYNCLHPQALAQVLLATQLTSLRIDAGVQGMSDGIVMGMVANLHNLRSLHIRCCHRQLAEISMIVQLWLPNLQFLWLYGLRRNVEGPAIDEWLSHLQHSRPDLEVRIW
jgi:hypothetical protein